MGGLIPALLIKVGFNPQREGYKPSHELTYRHVGRFQSPKGRLQTEVVFTDIHILKKVSIPKGKATNIIKLLNEIREKLFQSPKGRLQT